MRLPARQVLPDGHASRSAIACSTRSSARCRRDRSAPTRSPPATAPARAAARRSARATRSTPRCAPPTGRLIAANATGCLEVFSTPYPEIVVAAALDPFAVRQRAGGRHRHRRGAARRKGRERRPRGRAGRRRRHARHRLRLPVGDVRAQRRRALHLLRQRGLHEHRRAALGGDAAGRAHGQHPGLAALHLQRCRDPGATAGALPNSQWIHGSCHDHSGYGVENTSRRSRPQSASVVSHRGVERECAPSASPHPGGPGRR